MNKAIITILFLSFIIIQTAYPQKASSKDYIFVIDQSSSMNRNNLFTKVKQALDSKLTKKIKVGDNVTILGFDSDVRIIANKKISNINDRFEIQGTVAKLKARGDWTYITHALEITAQELEQIKGDGAPIKLVYLMTDGHNDPPPSIKNPTTYKNLLDKYFSTWTQKNTFITFIRFGVKGEDVEQKKFITKTKANTKDVINPDTIKTSSDLIPDKKIKEDTTAVDSSVVKEDVEVDQNSSFEISSEFIYIIIVLLIIALFLLICKFLLPKFSDNIELVVEDRKTNRNYGDYSLSDYNKFCVTSVTVGDNKDIDVDLDGNILKLTPSKNGIQIKVVNGEVWDQIESDENLYTSGKSFKAFSDSEILTDKLKLKFNYEDDFTDDDEEDELSENE